MSALTALSALPLLAALSRLSALPLLLTWLSGLTRLSIAAELAGLILLTWWLLATASDDASVLLSRPAGGRVKIVALGAIDTLQGSEYGLSTRALGCERRAPSAAGTVRLSTITPPYAETGSAPRARS